MSTRGRDPTPRGQTQLPNHGSGLQAAARPGILNRRDLRQKCQKSDSSPGLESAGKPRASSLGHPGLPCGLWKMTCPEVEDRPPKLLPQVSLASASAPAVRASSPGLARSRLQLKPATSPKLELEQYLTVTTSDPAAVSQLAAAPDLASLSAASAKPRKAAAAASPGARLPSSAPSPAAKPEPAPASASPQAAGEKKTKRDSLTRKSSAPVLIPWSRRNKEPPRRSGGWSWKGDSFLAKVHLNVSAGRRKITYF